MTEHKYGSEVVQLICNVALMTGKVGRPGSALLPLRGQNNVQGSSDMGALPDTYTAYRRSATRTSRARSRSAWGVTLSREKGYTIPQMFDAAVAGDLKAMYIFGEDVAQTDPNTAHVVAALENLEFLVCQDIFETETTKYADVILPASSFLEKSGTFTNAERRIQLVDAGDRAARRRARPTSRSSRRCRARSATRWAGTTPEDAMREIAALTPHFAGVTYERIGRNGPAVAGRARRHRRADPLRARVRAAPAGTAHFAALPVQGAGRRRRRGVPADPRHRPPPAALQRGHDDAPHRQPRAHRPRLLEIHPDDAARLWIEDGDADLGPQPHRPDRDHRAGHRPDRARARLHHVPLPRDADQPARRRVGRRQHVLPGVQGRSRSTSGRSARRRR